MLRWSDYIPLRPVRHQLPHNKSTILPYPDHSHRQYSHPSIQSSRIVVERRDEETIMAPVPDTPAGTQSIGASDTVLWIVSVVGFCVLGWGLYQFAQHTNNEPETDYSDLPNGTRAQRRARAKAIRKQQQHQARVAQRKRKEEERKVSSEAEAPPIVRERQQEESINDLLQVLQTERTREGRKLDIHAIVERHPQLNAESVRRGIDQLVEQMEWAGFWNQEDTFVVVTNDELQQLARVLRKKGRFRLSEVSHLMQQLLKRDD